MFRSILSILAVALLGLFVVFSPIETYGNLSSNSEEIYDEYTEEEYCEMATALINQLHEYYPDSFFMVEEGMQKPDIPVYKLSSEAAYKFFYSLNAVQDVLGLHGNVSETSEKLSYTQNTVLTIPSAKSSTYGAAVPYYYSYGNGRNCYGYAMIQPMYVHPGFMTAGGAGSYAGESVNTVAARVISDYNARSLGARVISGGLSPVNSNEYRIATRVGAGYVQFSDGMAYVQDYHFMVQTNVGDWAEKHSAGSSVNRGAINPATANWDYVDGWGITRATNFYNSATYFLAVRLY